MNQAILKIEPNIERVMSDFKSDFLRVLSERGYIHQISDVAGLDQAAADKRIVSYVGYDCTAPSLHIGRSKAYSRSS